MIAADASIMTRDQQINQLKQPSHRDTGRTPLIFSNPAIRDGRNTEGILTLHELSPSRPGSEITNLKKQLN